MNNLLTHSITEALGWILLHTLWIFCLIAIVYRILLWIPATRKAQISYALSLGTLSLMLGSAIFLFCWIYEPPVHFVEEHVVQHMPTFLPEISPLDTVPSQVPIQTLDTLDQAIQSYTLPAIPWWKRGVETMQSYTEPYIPMIVLAWILGIAILMIRFLGGWTYLHRLRYQDTLKVDPKWEKQLSELADKMGIHRQVQVFISRRIHEPLTIGHFKPVILIPVGLLTQQPPKQVEAILLHELAHIRRYDFLFNVLQSWIEILFFYHPAVWWVSQQTREAREHCCDDQAVSICQDPLLYAQALAQVQLNKVKGKQHPDLALSASGNKPNLTDRIYRIMGEPKQQLSPSRGTIVAMILLISSFIFAFQQYVPQEYMSDDTTEEVSWDYLFYNASQNSDRKEMQEWIDAVKLHSGVELQIEDNIQGKQERGHFWVGNASGKDELFSISGDLDQVSLIFDRRESIVYMINYSYQKLEYYELDTQFKGNYNPFIASALDKKFTDDLLKKEDFSTSFKQSYLRRGALKINFSMEKAWVLYQSPFDILLEDNSTIEDLLEWKFFTNIQHVGFEVKSLDWDEETNKLRRITGAYRTTNQTIESFDIRDFSRISFPVDIDAKVIREDGVEIDKQSKAEYENKEIVYFLDEKRVDRKVIQDY